MSVWVEMFDEKGRAPGVYDTEVPRRDDRTVHPETGRALNSPGIEIQDKRLAMTFADDRGATHLRFYNRGGKFEYLRKADNGVWRKSDRGEFHTDLGLEEPLTLETEGRQQFKLPPIRLENITHRDQETAID